MILWTIQPIEIWEELKTKGYYICDPKKAEYIYDNKINLKKQYLWLVNQMCDRVGKQPDGVHFPVWAWHTYNSKHKKPDLRHRGYQEPGSKCVCMEIDIPSDQVLLSDFDGWHFVLGDFYYYQDDSEEEFDRIEEWLDTLSDEQRTLEIEKSWLHIFDVERLESDWNAVGRYIQATFWMLKLEQVKEVKYFTAR